MTAGKSQRGPMVRSAGRAQYNPPTATTAMSAGTPVKVYGIAQAGGTLMGYAVIYYTGMAPMS